MAMEDLEIPIKLIRPVRTYIKNSKCKIKFNGHILKEFNVKQD